MSGKNEITRKGLSNIMAVKATDRESLKRKFNSLSPEAQKEVNKATDDMFYARNLNLGENFKIDSGNPAHKQYEKEWLKTRDEVLRWKTDWEKGVMNKKKETEQINKEIAKTEGEIDQNIKIINENLSKILHLKDGKKFLQFVVDSFSPYGVDKGKVSYNITKRLEAYDVSNAYRSKEGVEALILMYKELITDQNNSNYLKEANKLIKYDLYPSSQEKIPGILDNGYTGNSFLNMVNKELFDTYGANKYIGALNITTRLSNEDIKNASKTKDGFKALMILANLLKSDSFDKENEIKASDQFNRIFKAISVYSDIKTERPKEGYIEKGYSVKNFIDFVNKEFSEHGSAREQAAINIVRNMSDKDLTSFVRQSKGINALLKLYKTLITSSDPEAIKQSHAILRAFGSKNDPAKGLVEHNYIFPLQFTAFNSSHISAKVENGMIHVRMYQTSMADHPESLLMAGTSLYTAKGIDLKPEEWVKIKLYDEGGTTIYRPALYLLNMSDKSTSENWKNIIDIGSLALPGGLFARGGTIASKGIVKGIEKAVEYTIDAMMLSNLVVRENRGWIIKKFGDDGRKFIESYDLVTTILCFTQMSKTLLTPAIKRMADTWKQLEKIETKLSPNDAKKFQDIGKDIKKTVTETEKGIKSASKEAGPPRKSTDLKQPGDVPKGSKDKLTAEKTSEQENFERIREEPRNSDWEDLKFGITHNDEAGIVMHISKKDDPIAIYLKNVNKYNNREWQLIHDVTENEYLLVHGTDREVCQKTIESEFKGHELVSLRHYHPRAGQDHVLSIFGSTNDMEALYEGVYKRNNFNTIDYFDYKTGAIEQTYIIKLPENMGELNKAANNRLKKYFGEQLDPDKPYVIIYRDPSKNKFVGRQFKNLGDYKDYIHKKANALLEDKGKLTESPDRKGSQNNKSITQDKKETIPLKSPEKPTIQQELKQCIKELETDPELRPWVEHRGMSQERFMEGVQNLPEETQKNILDRLKEGSVGDSVGNRKFVLAQLSHEFRVNDYLEALQIKGKHGDFTGPANKSELEVAKQLSRTGRDKDIENTIADHGRSRAHHNPVTADDYLHAAVDQYDALRDYLRTKESGFGYKDKLNHEHIKDILQGNAHRDAKNLVDQKLREKAGDLIHNWMSKYKDFPKSKEAVQDAQKLRDTFNITYKEEIPRIKDKESSRLLPKIKDGTIYTKDILKKTEASKTSDKRLLPKIREENKTKEKKLNELKDNKKLREGS